MVTPDGAGINLLYYSGQMALLVLSQADVDALLPHRECIGVMEQALSALARGQAHQPLRTLVRPPGAAGLMGLMPSYMGAEGAAFGLKAVCVFASNPARGLDTHQGGVLLFSAETGELQAVVNASAVTAIRTAAVSALATRVLARTDAHELAVIGAGVQARHHIKALAEVRRFRRARVASRKREEAARMAAEMRDLLPFPIEAVDGAEAAVAGAHVVVTTTTSPEPVVLRRWLSPGVHLCAVGSCFPTARELDTATVRDARFFCDRRESVLAESGDYLIAAREGAIGPEHIQAELGEVLIGEHPGRRSPDEITLFKSLGLAVEDLAAASFLHRKATERGAGQRASF